MKVQLLVPLAGGTWEIMPHCGIVAKNLNHHEVDSSTQTHSVNPLRNERKGGGKKKKNPTCRNKEKSPAASANEAAPSAQPN